MKTKIIYRTCVICGKRIRIRLYKDGHYINGHYFNKMKLPVKGTGKYKKVKTTKLFGEKIDVVKWIGKEKKVEYWECNKCYEEAMHEDWLEKTIEKLFGKRCPDYVKDCTLCKVWDIYDTIIDANRGRL